MAPGPEILPTPPPRTDPTLRQPLEQPTAVEAPQPPAIQPAQPVATDRPLPINLATALELSNARPLVIAFAQASVEEAAARLQGAQVLWLPNLNTGFEYLRHDGFDQSTDGSVIQDSKNALAVGCGATLIFGVTDAIFVPLAARQELAARQWDLQTARNDALLRVAVSYFDVQEARGKLAGTLDAAAKADELLRRIESLAKGLVAEIEVDRARTLQADLNQEVAAARAAWRINSSKLVRVLRLNPSAVVVPVEPSHLQVTLIPPGRAVDDLIPIGLTCRPELASQQSLVRATLERLRQERLRPLLPNVIVGSNTGPGGTLNGSIFAGGRNDNMSSSGGRFDMDMGLVWTLNNLGAGNRALVRQRSAQQREAIVELYDVQDRVAQEVVQAHAELDAAAAQVQAAAVDVREAEITYRGNLIGIGQTRGAGDLLQLVNRPQEAVAALQALDRAYQSYFFAVNDYNRAEFQLYRALGYPARTLICDCPVGEPRAVDTSRPAQMAPAGPR